MELLELYFLQMMVGSTSALIMSTVSKCAIHQRQAMPIDSTFCHNIGIIFQRGIKARLCCCSGVSFDFTYYSSDDGGRHKFMR